QPFVSGEALLAAQAFTPAADGFALFALARVHHPVLYVAAKGTFHEPKSSCRRADSPDRRPSAGSPARLRAPAHAAQETRACPTPPPVGGGNPLRCGGSSPRRARS